MLDSILSRVAATSSALLLDEDDADDVIAVNVEAVRELLPRPSLPSWRAVAGACGSALGVVQAALCAELENTAQHLAKIEYGVSEDGAQENDEHASSDASCITLNENTHGLALPAIVITPCPDDPPRTHDELRRCFVPLQDACFGNRLCVPAYPVVNDAFPPLVRVKPMPYARRWEYVNGHWRAILPSVEEQARRGWLSRSLALGARRRRVVR